MPNRSAILIKVKGFECKPGARPGLPRKNLIWNLNGGICIPLLLWRLFTRRKWKSPEGRWNSFDSIAISGEQRAFPSYPKLLRIFFYPLLSLIVKLEAEQSCWNIVSFSEIFYVTLTSWFFFRDFYLDFRSWTMLQLLCWSKSVVYCSYHWS